MMPKTPSRKLLRALCAEVHPDDGLDPRLESRGGRRPSHRKARQLAAQAGEAIEAALAESPEDVLQSLRVVAVEPAPDTTRLLVTLSMAAFEPPDPALALALLDRASARLRCAVAAAITRRKAPALAFRLALAPA